MRTTASGRTLLRAALLSALLLAPGTAMTQNPEAEPLVNLPTPTLGGKQFWADVFLYADWRLQEHVWTGHVRLLDPGDVRRCWGTYEQCREVFEKLRRDQAIAPASDRLVFLIHGLGRAKESFVGLETALRNAGYQASSVNYPSTRRGLTAHADQLERLLNRLEGVERVSFVTHSLGGLVLRELLTRDSAWKTRIEPGRAVLIAPPNQGSAIADRLQDFAPYQWLLGAGGQAATSEAATPLPVPPIPFAVIAGGRGDGTGYNPLLEGDDDGVVTIQETRLDGAAGFLVVDAAHTVIMNHPRTIAAVLSFLEDGQI
jgi:pimeloyl-ACP methyl ester carboxylesterase